MKTEIWLLWALLNGSPHYEVYNSLAECEVASVEWQQKSGWFFASGIRRSFCSSRDVTPEERAVYERAEARWRASQ